MVKDNLIMHKKILLVEDEAIIAMDTVSILESFGCIVVGIASSGEKAIELAESLMPDVVLMDIRLAGGLDGMDTANIILEKTVTQVIFVSSHIDVNKMNRLKLSERCLSVEKPFQKADLCSALIVSLTSRGFQKAPNTKSSWSQEVPAMRMNHNWKLL